MKEKASPGVHVRAHAVCAVNTMSRDKIASAVISQHVYNALSKVSEVTFYEKHFLSADLCNVILMAAATAANYGSHRGTFGHVNKKCD